jgi:glutathione S-transferase
MSGSGRRQQCGPRVARRENDAGTLAPAPGTPERLRYTYWLHFAEGSAMPPLLLKLVFERNLDFMERKLGGRARIAGPAFTAADIQMSFPLEAAAARGRPRLAAFLDDIHARPAYQRALQRGGKYELLR